MRLIVDSLRNVALSLLLRFHLLFFSVFNLLYDSIKLPYRPICNDVLLYPSFWLCASAPHLVSPAFHEFEFCSANDLKLRSKGFDALEAILVVVLNLKVFFRLKILEVVDFVSSHFVATITTEDFKRPLSYILIFVALVLLLNAIGIKHIRSDFLLNVNLVLLFEARLVHYFEENVYHCAVAHKFTDYINPFLIKFSEDIFPTIGNIHLGSKLRSFGFFIYSIILSYLRLIDLFFYSLGWAVSRNNFSDGFYSFNELYCGFFGSLDILEHSCDNLCAFSLSLHKANIQLTCKLLSELVV